MYRHGIIATKVATAPDQQICRRVNSAALTSGHLWGSACVYHGLVGTAWLVADLWGSPQGI